LLAKMNVSFRCELWIQFCIFKITSITKLNAS
jgi:hypothetical protein